MFFKHLNSIKIERTSTIGVVINKHRSELIISKHHQQQQQQK